MEWVWVYRCAPLSASCAIDWEAWSAVATAAGVLLALAMPALRWLWTRKRVNTLFALAHERDLRWARARLISICEQYPVGRNTVDAWGMEAALMTSRDERERFGKSAGPLVAFAERQIDLSRWPSSVSLELASAVALAQSSCHAVADGLKAGSNAPDRGAEWDTFWPRFRRELDAAITDCDVAVRAIERATGKSAGV